MNMRRVVVGLLIAFGVTASMGPAGFATNAIVIDNLQMNTDHNPPTAQNETAVAFNVFNPMNAVAAANDRLGGTVRYDMWIGYTTDGGRHWSSTFKIPQ